MIAALPMYDWPEVAPATDRLWGTVRDALRAEGIAAPEGLSRDPDHSAAWTDPALVLGQTCGLPFVTSLRGRVALVGVLDYRLPGCPPGWYRSALVVRADDPRRGLADFRGARLAINGRDSQSGFGSVLHAAAPFAEDGRFFGEVTVSGAHRAALRAVAAGTADIAAIDYVSWRLARRFEPEAAAAVRLLALTDPTPGLPLIAAPGADLAGLRRALAAAIAPDAELGVAGFVPLEPAAFELIADRFAAAGERLHI